MWNLASIFDRSYLWVAWLIAVLAAFIALRSIVLVDLLGIEKLTSAFGLTALFQGFAALFGSPIAGKFLH